MTIHTSNSRLATARGLVSETAFREAEARAIEFTRVLRRRESAFAAS